LYQYGGIYFDTDVEVIKPFDDILARGGFMGIESVGKVIEGLGIGCNAGLGIGCNAGLGIVYQILDFYAGAHFINADGSYNLHTVVEYVTAILERNGFKSENSIQHLDGITIYPVEYFCPMNFETGEVNITSNTYSIHHYNFSWNLERKEIINKKYKLYKYIKNKTFCDFVFKYLIFLNRLKINNNIFITLKEIVFSHHNKERRRPKASK
jgi:hypothetical protein